MTKEKEQPNEEPKKDDGDEIMEVTKSDMRSILDKIKRLEKAANLSALAKYDAKHNPQELETIIKVRTFEGKIVMGWSDMKTNTCEKTPQGNWVEDQQVEITFEDGEKKVMPYTAWINTSTGYKHIPAKIIGEKKVNSKSRDDFEREFELELLEDGRTLNIHEKFVN